MRSAEKRVGQKNELRPRFMPRFMPLVSCPSCVPISCLPVSCLDFALMPSDEGQSTTWGIKTIPGDIHGGGANVLFWDGHVRWFVQSDLVADTTDLGPCFRKLQNSECGMPTTSLRATRWISSGRCGIGGRRRRKTRGRRTRRAWLRISRNVPNPVRHTLRDLVVSSTNSIILRLRWPLE